MLDTTTIGRALRDTRELAELRPRAAARALGVRPATLRAWETARTTPTIAGLARATEVYAAGLGDLLPPRVPLIDPNRPGELVVGDETIRTTTVSGGLLDPRSANRDLLERYVAAVRRQRGIHDRDALELRREDVAALAGHLDLGDAALEALLTEILGTSAERAVTARRALLVGALITIVATGAVPDAWCRVTPTSPSPMRSRARTWTAIPPDVVDLARGRTGDQDASFSPWVRRTVRDPATTGDTGGGSNAPTRTPFSVEAIERPMAIPLKPFSDEPREPERPTFSPRAGRSAPERFGPRQLFAAAERSADPPGSIRALPPTR